jgi:hypothetical protein
MSGTISRIPFASVEGEESMNGMPEAPWEKQEAVNT